MAGRKKAPPGSETGRASAPRPQAPTVREVEREAALLLRAQRKSAPPGKRGRARTFRAVGDRVYELHLSARVALDLLVTIDGEVMTFVRVDGTLVGELKVLGEA